MLHTAERDTLIIRTPEGVAFRLVLAGPTVRCCAAITDGLIVMGCNIALATTFSFVSMLSPGLFGFLVILGQFVITTGYAIATEWFMSGQSFGKKLFRIRVLDSLGLPLQFNQVLVRNLMRPIDLLPLFYLVGGISCFMSRSRQRLGDIVAGTVVISVAREKLADIGLLTGSKYNSLKSVPHVVGRLRQTIGAHDAALALESLTRAPQLEAAARLELFGRLAARFRQLGEVPAELTDGVPDETFVANVVDVLYGGPRQAYDARTGHPRVTPSEPHSS